MNTFYFKNLKNKYKILPGVPKEPGLPPEPKITENKKEISDKVVLE